MKIKTLKNILNTGYILQHRTDTGNLCLGSSFVSDLIEVDRKTLKIRVSCIFNERHTELVRLRDKLQELIDSGEIQDIFENNDVIENPITIYRSIYLGEDYVVQKTVCETFGYPNTDIDGYLQYENTHFLSAKEALEHAIRNEEAGISGNDRTIEQVVKQLYEAVQDRTMCVKRTKQFKKRLEELDAGQCEIKEDSNV
jgi:chromosome segregation ATPase